MEGHRSTERGRVSHKVFVSAGHFGAVGTVTLLVINFPTAEEAIQAVDAVNSMEHAPYHQEAVYLGGPVA